MKSVNEQIYDIPNYWAWRDIMDAAGSEHVSRVGRKLNDNLNSIHHALTVAIGVRDEISKT